MNIAVTVISGADKLNKSGKGRDVFDLTHTLAGYYFEKTFLPFAQKETFYLMKGHANSAWVRIVTDYGRIRLSLEDGKLIGVEDRGSDGIAEIVWSRERCSPLSRVVVTVDMDDDWYVAPRLIFMNKDQYDLFMKAHDTEVAKTLNLIYSSYGSDDRVNVKSVLGMSIAGDDANKLYMVKGDKCSLLQADGGKVYEHGMCKLSSVGPMITFTLKYGQHKAFEGNISGKRILGGLPGINPEAQCSGREWIPQLKQIVTIDGLDDAFVIEAYYQDKGIFVLTLADKYRCQEDMLKHGITTPRNYKVSIDRVMPLVLTY
ncbi:hypothetical protein D3C85_13980 [compost metagenome]